MGKVHLNIVFSHLSAVDCGPLSVPTNGSSSGESTVFPNTVLFRCDPGFLLQGSSSRKCQANGTWSGYSATCVGRLRLYGRQIIPPLSAPAATVVFSRFSNSCTALVLQQCA